MDYSINTKCVQAGYTPGNGEPRQIPIIQSTTYKYNTSEDMGKLFDLEAEGYFYSRLQNPTNDYVAAKITALEGGKAGMLTSSGQAANFFALFNICEAGSHIVASSSIYGGTYNLISVTMKKMGVDVTFVDPDCTEEELNAAFQENTKVVFGESIANPALTVLDIEKFAKAAHAHGVPLIVDNTFPTPVNLRPIEWGADIVTHSTTKYMDGHGAALGGAIIDGGNFDWMAHADKFPGLCTPDESYHGITYAEKFGKEGAFITKCTSQLMRDLGCAQSPQSAFILNLGLESLHVRMPRHVENGQAVAEFLEKHDKVEFVNYPTLPSNKYYEIAKKYLPNGGCGVVSFELKGGREAAEKFMKNLKLAAIETHVADARTCCLNPATSTHRQMTDEQLITAGIPAGLIRISCGLEDKNDLVDAVSASDGKTLALGIRRDGRRIEVDMTPVLAEDGSYKLGAWVRDDTQGIGTMTYVDMNGNFGALGHGISDSDTGELVDIEGGELYETQILGIEKGQTGKPGVMSGVIYYGKGTKLGEVKENTTEGIYGTVNQHFLDSIKTDAIPVGFRQDTHKGTAYIRSNVSGEVKDYEIEIQKVDYGSIQKNKGLVLRVVDEELLNLTSGIVQGMSGSPIIQDGKLIGAVTHVFINDPTRGYGIFAENMISH